jgi:hypothetical protein
MEIIDIVLSSILIFVIGFSIERAFHYRRLWLRCKNKVSWVMPSNDPNKWAVEKTYSHNNDVFPTSYAVVDRDTKVHVANDFKTEDAAREYIQHHMENFSRND